MSRPLSGLFSTRFHLFGLVAAIVIPLIAFGGLVVVRFAQAERARVEQEAVRIAGLTALLVDADLKQLTAKLEGLATSSALAQNDFARFHAEANHLTDGRDETIILRDMQVGQLLNSKVPYGTPLPAGPAFSTEELSNFRQGKPHISDVYASPRSGDPRVVIALPVLRDGQAAYVLGITIPTSRVRDTLLSAVPPGYVVAVGDRQGAYVARSSRHEEVTGKPGLPEYVRQVVGRSGSFKSANFEGKQLLAGYQRLDSGWFFTANIPMDMLEQPLSTSLWQLAFIGAAALALSTLLAMAFSRSIINAAGGLEDRARTLGQGQGVVPLNTHLFEFAVVGDALVGAGEAISARARERERATEREALLASIFDAVGVHVGVIETDGASPRWVVANRATSTIFDLDHEDGSLVERFGLDDADRVEFERLCHQSLKQAEPLTSEFTLGANSDEARTYLGTFTGLAGATGSRTRVAFTAMDITDRKRAEVHRQLLVNELNHRVKNSLMIAQSIVLQTLRAADSPNNVRAAVSSRLISLARTHDILTRENWEGAYVEDLLTHLVDALGSAGRVSMSGPDARLLPGPALTLSLLVHELLTNSLKHGALSSEKGSVVMQWMASANTDGMLAIRIAEINGPPVTPPTHRGFGSRLFEASFASRTEGMVTVAYSPTGVVCEIEIQGLAS